MLPLPADLPSKPGRAYIKPHRGEVATETNIYKNYPYRGTKSPQNRKQRKAHNWLPKPQESPKPPEPSELYKLPKLPGDNAFIQDQKVAKKRPDVNCVFLLWGSGNFGNSENSGRFTAWAVDVPITDAESEHEIFALLAKQYATRLGFLRRCLSFQRFSRLRPVTFRFISRSSKRFSALAEPLDLDKHRKIFSKRQEEAMEIISPITDFDSDDPGHCYRDNSSGEYEHCNGACPFNTSKSHSVPQCPFEEWEFCNDLLKWVEDEPFLSSYFRDPAGARSQNIPICFIGHCFIHKYKKIFLPPAPRRLKQPRPQNRDEKLNGLYVETKLDRIRCVYVFLGILLCVIAGGRIVWGTWEVVFDAGSFFVALPVLVLTLLSHY